MKRISILVCLLLFSTTLFAQEEKNATSDFFSDWVFGIKGGYNASNMYGDVGNNSFLSSGHLGVVADKNINEDLALSTEPHFSGEGQNLNGGYDRIIYFNIPVLVKFSATDALSLDGGVHAGVKVTEKTKFSNGNTENRNRFKRIAPGITGGATYKIDSNWFAQFRTNLKLSDVVRKEGGDSEGSTILLFQFSIGHSFN